MKKQIERVTNVTRRSWGVPKNEKPSALDGVNAGGESTCQPESEGAGLGAVGDLCGDLQRRESHAVAIKSRRGRSGRWAGSTVGVRPPERGETPLSPEEVAHGIEHSIIEHVMPIVQIVKPMDAWAKSNMHLMSRAQPFDGLLA